MYSILHPISRHQAQGHVCQHHTKMFMKAITSKVLPKSLSELTSMSGENIREKLYDENGIRPIKYKLRTKKDVQYKTTGVATLSKK